MSQTEKISNKLRALIFIIFFASGFCGLVYEVIWVRMLGLILGNSIYAVSLVIAAFMAGLGLGALLAGRFIENRPDPLRVYAVLEFGIGAFGILSPLILSLLTPVYIWIGHNLVSSPLMMNLFRFILAFLMLLVPTVMMGATLPVISKFLVRRQSHIGSAIGFLYGLNTFGAMAGCLAAGFIMVEHLGVNSSILVTALINILIAAAILWIGRGIATTQEPNRKPVHEISAKENLQLPKKIINIVLIIFALSGMAAIAYEVIWTRALSFFVGHTGYAFTAMLGTLLFGIGLGSVLISKFSDKTRNLLITLAIVEMLIGLLCIIGVPLLGKVFYSMENSLGKRTWATPIWAKFAYSFIIMFLPCLLMGMTFPLVGKIYVNINSLGRRLGTIYAINTAGGIVGSFLAAFLLIPALGVHIAIFAVALLNITLGITVAAITPFRKKFWRASFVIAGVVVAIAGTFALSLGRDTYSVKNRIKWGTPLYYKEGLTNTIEILQRDDGSRDLFIDGELNASTSTAGVLIHRMLSQVPLMLHHDPKNIFLVGLGSGMTAGAALPFQSIQSIDCAEISTDIIDAANNFGQWNDNVLHSGKFHLQIEDGRIVLLTNPQNYDVMVTGIIHPKYNAGNAGLYSRDYYELCKSRLAPDGIMCQWIPLTALSQDEFKMVIRTFQDVFPHSSLWFEELFGGSGNFNALLLGSQKKLEIDYENLAAKFNDPRIAEKMREVGVTDINSFLNHFMTGEQDLKTYASGSTLISDNRPRLEFGAVTVSDFTTILSELGRRKESAWPYLVDLPSSQEEQAAIQQALGQSAEMAQSAIEADSRRHQGNISAALAEYENASKLAPQNPVISKERTNLERTASALRKQKSPPPADSAVSPAIAKFNIEIEKYLEKVNAEPKRADLHFNLASMYQRVGRLNEAIAHYLTALELRPTYLQAQNNLGIAYLQTMQYDKAETLFNQILQKYPKYIQAMTNLAQCYTRTGRKDQAIAILEKALEYAPGDKIVIAYLDKLRAGQ